MASTAQLWGGVALVAWMLAVCVTEAAALWTVWPLSSPKWWLPMTLRIIAIVPAIVLAPPLLASETLPASTWLWLLSADMVVVEALSWVSVSRLRVRGMQHRMKTACSYTASTTKLESLATSSNAMVAAVATERLRSADPSTAEGLHRVMAAELAPSVSSGRALRKVTTMLTEDT